MTDRDKTSLSVGAGAFLMIACTAMELADVAGETAPERSRRVILIFATTCALTLLVAARRWRSMRNWQRAVLMFLILVAALLAIDAVRGLAVLGFW